MSTPAAAVCVTEADSMPPAAIKHESRRRIEVLLVRKDFRKRRPPFK
jgi:hypothetical protein